jgi:hypothetical protein
LTWTFAHQGMVEALGASFWRAHWQCERIYIARGADLDIGAVFDEHADASARVRGSSVDHRFIDSLRAAIERVRAEDDFTARARRLLERDREILDRLAR